VVGTVSILLISILILTSVNGVLPVSTPAGIHLISEKDYVTHDPIIIDSNDDFETQFWPGEGTFQSPYIIQGLEITGNICVDISQTTVNFEIRDCYLIASGAYGCGVELNELQNATIRNCIIDVSYCTGINLDYAFNCSILGNNVISESTSGFGIYLRSLHTGEVSDNSVTLDGGGIQLVGCTDVSVLRNTVSGDQSRIGISDTQSSVIINNTIMQGGFLVSGHPEDYINDFSGNLANGLPVGYFVNEKNLEIEGTNYAQVFLANSSEVRIIGGTFNHCYVGVKVAWSTNCFVERVSTEGNDIGIELSESLNCEITNCTSIQNNCNIRLTRSDNCSVLDCEAAYASTGVEIFYSSFCNISRCKIYSNNYGIRIRHDGGFYDNSIENRIWDNIMGWNIFNAEDDAPTSFWDNGVSIGNKWSDYSVTGPYEVPGDGGTQDNYPSRLVDNQKPTISHPEDIYYEEGVDEYFITWLPSDEFPSWYKIIGVNADEHPWRGTQITCNVSDYVLDERGISVGDLPWGVFNITVIVSDGAGNQAVDTVLIYSVLYSPENNHTTTTSNLQSAITLVMTILSVTGGIVGVAVLVLIVMKRRK
jgi:parallel beta-helix repeat protein